MTDTDSLADPRIALLRARIGWICKAVNIGAVLLVVWGLAIRLLIWSDRAGLIGRWQRLYKVDPASIADFGFNAAGAIYVSSWLFVGVLAWTVSRLTRGYLSGEIFTLRAATRMRHVAFAGLAVLVADILQRPVLAALLTSALFDKLPLYSWIEPFDLVLALFSGFMLALAQIFRTAVTIADEHRQFV